MITGIDIVFLHITNKSTVDWYKEFLNLEAGYQTDDGVWTEFALSEDRPPTRFALEYSDATASPVEKQSIMISFRVHSIHEVVETLEHRGVEFFGNPKIMQEGPSLFATLQDPEGNWIQVSQRISE
jgi:hypothetical protein